MYLLFFGAMQSLSHSHVNIIIRYDADRVLSLRERRKKEGFPSFSSIEIPSKAHRAELICRMREREHNANEEEH